MESIVNRMQKFLELKGLKTSAVERQINVSNGSLSKPFNANLTIKTDTLEKFLKEFSDISPSWLLTGEGEMLLEETKLLDDIISEESAAYNVEKSIPFVRATAIGGSGSTVFSIHERDVKAYYVVPKFEHKQVDFMIEVEGSSMYPKYNSGDVVACRKIPLDSFIQWNKCHVVATKDQGIIIKRVKKGQTDQQLCMHSDNKDYEPFEVPIDEIDGIALVVGVIRLE